ncbi:hypothetical protein TSUD_225650 [Trifolium subterraneum]|uniref:Uncharacterized protein n=1 Tax=Trifolium subterraneum TaxID=3900 RepID=A0A2Z6MLH6_TRISU|nr:hypothetical protein TSUD_225650 [Trifolium subterraneum]
MAVGKRLRSRDEHLMLIIPMSSVTERRGDDRCPTVKWTWALCFGPCSTAQKWMSSTRWAFRPSPEQEPPKSSCSGTRMMTLVGRSSGRATAVRSSRPFTSVISALGPLDLCESWPLDQSNDPDLVGAYLLYADVLADSSNSPNSLNLLNFLNSSLPSSSRIFKVYLLDFITLLFTTNYKRAFIWTCGTSFHLGSPDLVKKSPVALSEAEQAIMNDMGPEALKNELADAMVAAFKLMEISSFLNGRECKYLEERDAAREEAAGLVTKLAEKETEAARLVGEKADLEERLKDLTTERDTLAGKVRDLESRPCSSGTAPDADELVIDPNGEYKGFTRAALVSRIFELEGKELDVAKSSFDNAVAQLMVLNPGVELIVESASELKEVLDDVIVSPSPDEEDQF